MIIEKIINTHNERKSMKLYGRYYRENRKKIYHMIKYFYKEEEVKIAIWGAGPKGIAFLRVIDPKKAYINTVIDIDVSKQGKKLLTGHIIEGIDAIKENGIEIILVMNSGFYTDIAEQIKVIGLNTSLISVDGFIQEDISVKELSNGRNLNESTI